MSEPTTSQATVTVLEQFVELRVTGQPDVPNQYGSGRIRPTEVSFRYRTAGIRAQVYGHWVRENGELTDAPITRDYAAHQHDMSDWPDWLASLAREHAPATSASPSPADRCVCGDPIELQDPRDPNSWIHSPGSDTPCLDARRVRPPANRAALRKAVADAIRNATCTGNCGKPEEQCAQERIQPFAWHHGTLAVVEGSPEQFADAVLPVLPPPADRAAVLHEAADRFAAFDLHAEAAALRRMADETPAAEAECVKHSGPDTKFCVLCLSGEHKRVDDEPAAETDEERADREETERDHARGDHTYCGITCEIEMPTEHLRNFVIAKGYPGTKGALAELERRARTDQPAAGARQDGPQ